MSRNYLYPDGTLNQTDLMNRVGSFFFLLFNIYFGVFSKVSHNMVDDNIIVYKEISSGMYTTWEFFITKTLADIILFTGPAVFLVLPVNS